MNNTLEDNQNTTVHLFEILRMLWCKRRFIGTFTGIITVIAILYSLLATPYYRSYISIYPVNEDTQSNTIGGLQGIASTFGINMGVLNKTSFYIPDIVNSRMLKKAIIEKKWNTEGYDEPVTLITFWKIDDTNGFNIKGLLNRLFSSSGYVDIYSQYMETAIETLSEQISISEEESGLIIVSILMEEPQLAADITNYIADYIKIYVSDLELFQTSKHREFIEDRLNNSQAGLSTSEEELTEFRKQHPISLDTPDLQLNRGRLIRNVETNQEVYLTLLIQYEIAKLEELKETPIVNILDYGEPAVKIAKPKRAIIVITSLLIALILSVFIKVLDQNIIN